MRHVWIYCIILSFKLLSQPIIEDISISGNSFFSEREILNMMNSSKGEIYNSTQLYHDIQNIIKNYNQVGFINCRINHIKNILSNDSSGVYITIHINEGDIITIGEINIIGNKLLTSSEIINKLEIIPGEVLNEFKLKYGISEIIKLYESKGYTFVSVRVSSIEVYGSQENEKIRLNINIDENEKIKIDNIIIEGNSTTKRETILREIRLKKGEAITREKLIRIKQDLENTGYFENVSLPEIHRYKKETIMLINVSEGNTNTIDGVLGYVPPNSNQEKGYFTGIAKLSLRNILGTGRKLDASFEKLELKTQFLEINYQEPWIMGYPVKASFGFSQRFQDSSFIQRSFTFKTEALISSRFSVAGMGTIDRVLPDFSSGVINQLDSRTISTGIEIKYDSRNYIYNPSSGILYKTGYIFGQKKIYNATSFQKINSYFSLQKIFATIDIYSSFLKRQTLMTSIRGIDIRLPEYEVSDLFRLGGLSTVRGYREGQFFVSRAVWISIEPRFSISRRSFLFAFYDGGYYVTPELTLNNSPVNREYIFGYGLGIRLETSIGIIGVSYGLGKGDSVLDGKLHFGILNDF